MEALPLPNRAVVSDLGHNKYSVVLEPLYPGYGVTIGNALRRVLLSSMPGAAVTSIKIKFADHEFSTIPNVKEDVIQIILNIKQLRLKSFSAEPVKLMLKVKGEKTVTAADIKETDQVEVINKDLYICTTDNKSADFEMELVVEQGRGYVTVEARENQKLELGQIGVDAIFTPVKSAYFDVTNVRVGQLTNFDRLELVMDTDGTITGQQAADIASHILVDHFSMMFSADFGKVESPAEVTGEIVAEAPAAEVDAADSIENSTLSTRAKNALTKNNILSISALKLLTSDQVANLSGLGDKTVKEIMEYLNR